MDSLQELLKSQDYDDEYFKVPALGTHYSQRWAMEDLLAEQREGSEPHGRNNEISNITPATIAQLDNKPGNANKLVFILNFIMITGSNQVFEVNATAVQKKEL